MNEKLSKLRAKLTERQAKFVGLHNLTLSIPAIQAQKLITTGLNLIRKPDIRSVEAGQ